MWCGRTRLFPAAWKLLVSENVGEAEVRERSSTHSCAAALPLTSESSNKDSGPNGLSWVSFCFLYPQS